MAEYSRKDLRLIIAVWMDKYYEFVFAILSSSFIVQESFICV